MTTIEMTIQGLTPMICNRFTEQAAMDATAGTRASMIGAQGTPREQCEPKLYMGADEKTLVIPGPNLFACIINAGTFFKVGKGKMTTQKSSLIPACLVVEDLEMPIVSKDGWDVFSRPIRNPATGGRRICHRPMFNDWELSPTMTLDETLIDPKLMRQVVDAAGTRVGLGDFRPACRGPYGRFLVTSWKESEGKSLV